MTIKCYSELIALPTFEERYRYLRLYGSVGKDTFGFDRIFNQMFYRSSEWKSVRDKVILRDMGCDLAIEGREIHGPITIHHMNLISLKDINEYSDFLINPEYLITTCHITHNAIHYGDEQLLAKDPIQRTRYDTCPWKK